MESIIAQLLTPGGLTGSGLALLIAVGTWRLFIVFRQSDGRSEAEVSLRQDLLKLNKDLLARADQFAKDRNDMARERNEALLKAAQMENERDAAVKELQAVIDKLNAGT